MINSSFFTVLKTENLKIYEENPSSPIGILVSDEIKKIIANPALASSIILGSYLKAAMEGDTSGSAKMLSLYLHFVVKTLPDSLFRENYSAVNTLAMESLSKRLSQSAPNLTSFNQVTPQTQVNITQPFSANSYIALLIKTLEASQPSTPIPISPTSQLSSPVKVEIKEEPMFQQTIPAEFIPSSSELSESSYSSYKDVPGPHPLKKRKGSHYYKKNDLKRRKFE